MNRNKSGTRIVDYEIKPEGSLGLLALGARGIIEWRKVRDVEKRSEKNNG